MNRLTCYVALFLVLIITGCKKDPAAPAPTPNNNAVFTLASSSGGCTSFLVQGDYFTGVALTNSNIVTLQVNVTTIGPYSITTSPLNGISFTGSGTFTNTGMQTVVLRGTGTPTAPGFNVFPVSASNSACSFSLNVSNPFVPVTYVDDDHMLFGNPSNAAQLLDSANNYLMRKPWYSLSYSRDRGIPNWVSWHLVQGDLGNVSRQDDFRADATLPPGWYQVAPTSYSGSGFDRGHNIPSADRTSSVMANSSTFLMTNMIPQAPTMNQTTWANLEDSLRRLANAGNELYVVMGTYGSGGTGNNGFTTSIDGGRVTVPANVWKVALVIPNGNNDSSRVNTNTRVIAVNIANSNASTGNWKSYRTTVDAIEAATGYDLFRRLQVSLQATLESRVDNL